MPECGNLAANRDPASAPSPPHPAFVFQRIQALAARGEDLGRTYRCPQPLSGLRRGPRMVGGSITNVLNGNLWH